MKRSLWATVMFVALLAAHASAQNVGPYRGYGFWYDEWGNPVADAVANRINAETEIMINEYVNGCFKSVLKDYNDRLGAKRRLTNENQVATIKRLREKPDTVDVDRGSALNVVMADLLNPKGSLSELRSISVELDVRTIQQIPFKVSRKGANVTISLRRLHVKDIDWPHLLNGDDFKRDREVYVRAVEKALEQNLRIGSLKPETIAEVSKAVRALEDRVPLILAQKPDLNRQQQRVEANDFLKRLKGAAEILDRKDVTDVLADLDQFSGTTLADLLGFMRFYRLTFGPADSPEERRAYVMLFDRLKDQRQKYAQRRPDLFGDQFLWQPDRAEGPKVVPSQ
jgi:hypothetical protein